MITETVVDWNWHGFRRHCNSVINFFGFWFLEWQTSAMGPGCVKTLTNTTYWRDAG
jgi:hypothetical protein